MTTPITSPLINLNHANQVCANTIAEFYQLDQLKNIIATTLDDMLTRVKNGLTLPYFAHVHQADFDKKIELDIYITNPTEGKQLNHEARGKDYATNILSYPSDLPAEMLTVLPSIPLGELVICHEVVVRQANEQGKTIADHLTHLLVHGTLHLLGFDHELGEDERIEMEGFEIDILTKLNIANPYD
ncbi:rRNA maturation RNase YbeY [Psychrobacter sp. HD31]|uniref:rRNA maturation RNase YbeY n=1 Tax=Psychrobacter sp. HD31 TaxID=3112003 RepID=UPI003DA2DDA1